MIRGDGDLDSSVPRLPNRRHSLRNRVAPSVLQEDRALDACEAEWPEAVAEIRLLALTGCRRSEVLNLRWRDIGNDSIKLLDSKTGPRTVPCVFSHAGPRPPRVAPIINPSREGHRAPLKARRTSSSTHPQSSCRVSLSKTEAGWQSSSSRHRAIAHIHHRRDPLPQPAWPSDASRSRLETAPQHLRGRLLKTSGRNYAMALGSPPAWATVRLASSASRRGRMDSLMSTWRLRKTIDRYYDQQCGRDPDGRGLSWEHCYEFFREHRGDLRRVRDTAALQLGSYLASWGMYRGSSFLLQRPYTAHLPVIRAPWRRLSSRTSGSVTSAATTPTSNSRRASWHWWSRLRPRTSESLQTRWSQRSCWER